MMIYYLANRNVVRFLFPVKWDDVMLLFVIDDEYVTGLNISAVGAFFLSIYTQKKHNNYQTVCNSIRLDKVADVCMFIRLTTTE